MKRITLLIVLILFAYGLAYGQGNFFDETFGYNGIEITNTSEEGYGAKCILLPDGKILQAISQGTIDSWDAGIYRRQHNGKVDSSFGNNGSVFFLSDHHILDQQLTTYPDGRILFFAADFYGSPGYLTFIYRLSPSGIIDSTFGSNGKHFISDSTMSQIAVLNITGDDKIIATGEEGSYVGGYAMTRPALWRLDPYGKPDSSFGANGKIPISLGRDSMIVLTSCKDSNGRFVFFYRTVFEKSNEILALRAYENGVIDTTFGKNGLLTLLLTDSDFDIPLPMTFSDGGILFAVNFGANNKWRTALVKLTENGELDQTFGSNGTMEIVTGLDVTYICSLALDSSGRTVACGRMSTYSGKPTSSVFRILPKGVIDSSFGSDGALQLIEDYTGNASDILIQPDGKYLISGYSHSYEQGKYRIMIARLNPDPKSSVFGDILITSSISLHPTPSTDNCTVTYTLPNNSDCSLTLRDESGRAVKTFMTSEFRAAGKHEDELDLRGLAAGVYFLSLEHGGKVETAKLIKQ